MAQAVLDNHFVLPEFVTYNGTRLPFAYPPLSFYILAGIARFSQVSILILSRFFPLIFNLLCLILFSDLARALVAKKRVAILAFLLFPFLPKSYEWLIMGGGITRSVGFFFCLVTLCLAVRFFKESRTQNAFWKDFMLGLFLGLAGMSHLEWGVTAAVSLTLIAFTSLPFDLAFKRLSVIACVSFLAAAPWWIAVLMRHGVSPFIAASTTAEWQPLTQSRFLNSLWQLLEWRQLPWTLGIAAGSFLALRNRQWIFPVWLILIFVTTPRHGPTAATMPLAVLFGFALEHLWTWTRIHWQRGLFFSVVFLGVFLSASGLKNRIPLFCLMISTSTT